MITVYGLIDPRSGLVRYVGVTVDLRRRYRRHLTDSGDSYRVRWIKKLLEMGLKPGLVILETVEVAVCQEAERKWIKHFGREGLVNTTDGGDGLWNPSEDVRRKISEAGIGRRMPEEVREMLRKINTGNKYGTGHVKSQDARDRIGAAHRGKVLSEETRRKISETRLARGRGIGHQPTPETRKKISDANKGRPKSEEHKRKLSEARKRTVLLKRELQSCELESSGMA